MSTIGVAIAIPEPWAGVLQKCRASFGDPLADTIPAHITLVPPTTLDNGIDKVERHLADVASATSPFALMLAGTATFRPVSPVAFVVVHEGFDACTALADALRIGPLEQELTFPYHPHVTIAHDLDDETLARAADTLADFHCSFVARSFQLFVQDDDGVWRAATEFALGESA